MQTLSKSSMPGGARRIAPRRIARSISLIAALVVGAASLCASPAIRAAEVEVKLLDHQGIQKLIASKKGQVVVVDIWSTTCAPCLREYPNLVKLHHKYKGRGLACVSVSLDFIGGEGDKPENYKPKVLAVLKALKSTFDNVLATEDTDTMLDKLKIDGPPAVFVYDRAGKLAKQFPDPNAGIDDAEFTYEDVGKVVDRLIQSAPAAGGK